VGQVVHTLPEGGFVYGVTTLDDEVFLLRGPGRDEVEVYDVITYRLLRRLSVPNCRRLCDMTSCKHYRCVYISDDDVGCIHRLDSQGAATQWPVNDQPMRISVTKAHHVLVICYVVRKIKEFSTYGELLRELTLPDDVIYPWHAIQLTSGQFVVCQGGFNRDAVQRICTISADGQKIVRTHGGQRGSDTGQYNLPWHLAVDDDEFVFVADPTNRRVTLLSPTLDFVRHVVSRDKLKRWPRFLRDVLSRDKLKGHPWRLHLDVQRRRLYVVDNEYKGDEHVGRVIVFSV